jgi:hypothetical protein
MAFFAALPSSKNRKNKNKVVFWVEKVKKTAKNVNNS